MKEVPRKVIFADLATVKYQGVLSSLEAQKISCEVITQVPDLLLRLGSERFDICVINLLLGGIGPFELIENLRKSSSNPDLKIIVVTRQVHKLNIQNSIRAGSNDFIAEPFETMNLVSRILYHLGPVKVIEASGYSTSLPGAAEVSFFRTLLLAEEVMAKTPRDKMHEGLLEVLKQVSSVIDSNRTSLIVVDEKRQSGVVLATSDDPKFYNFPISLHKYPEVSHVVHTESLIFVEDISQNPLTKSIQSNVKSIFIGSLVVFPVHYQGEVVGVLHVRRPKTKDLPSKESLRILQAVANLMAAHANVAVMLRRIYKDFSSSSAA